MRSLSAVAGIVALLSHRAAAQTPVRLGAMGVVSATHTARIAGGGNARELRVEQTMLMGHATLLSGHLEFVSTVSLDRAFSDDGVLTLGAWGGGFYDRHHPHDYLSEAVASLVGDVGTSTPRPRVSLSAGKGVVPFGPDMPMDRPPIRSAANHHWSQIIERWFGAFAFRGERLGLEVAVFDGGGHAHASSEDTGHTGHETCRTCTASTSTTSGSARITAWATPWLEFRLSGAALRSPGHHAGAGTEHRMLNVTTSFDRATPLGRVTGTLEYGQVRIEQTYQTALGEVQLSRGRVRAYYRGEQSDRAEGARADRFRSAPEIQENAVGTTRWTVHTVGAGVVLRKAGVTLEPIAEFGLARVSSVGTVPIDVEALYGSRSLWSGVIAIRTSVGAHRRMGQYGAMAPRAAHAGGHQH